MPPAFDRGSGLPSQNPSKDFHLYGLSRDDVSYILTTFQGIAKEDKEAEGEGPTRRLVMEAFDAMKS